MKPKQNLVAVPVSAEDAVSWPDPKKRMRSEDIFGDAREVLILHGTSEYRLQITKAGKLILNK